MIIKYDKEAKALYIYLADIPDGGVDHTEELILDTVMLDKDAQGVIVGIEVLGVEDIVYDG